MTQRRLPCELDQRAEAATLTAYGGGPLVIEAFRPSGVAGLLDASVALERRKRGLQASEQVEGCWRAGRPAANAARTWRIGARTAPWRCGSGTALPAPQTARDFLDAFDEVAPPLCRARHLGRRL